MGKRMKIEFIEEYQLVIFSTLACVQFGMTTTWFTLLNSLSISEAQSMALPVRNKLNDTKQSKGQTDRNYVSLPELTFGTKLPILLRAALVCISLNLGKFCYEIQKRVVE